MCFPTSKFIHSALELYEKASLDDNKIRKHGKWVKMSGKMMVDVGNNAPYQF